MGKPKGRYVAKGVPGSYRIWNNKSKKYWGDIYDYFPEELLGEINADKGPEEIVKRTRNAQKLKR